MQSFALSSAASRHSVLRNTYALLSLTLMWSAGAAVVGAGLHFSLVGYLVLMVMGFVALFGTMALRNSVWGLVLVFAFTGIEGLSLGPVLQHYLHLKHGTQILATSAGLTGAMFLGLSGVVLVSRKDFSFLGGFLFAGLLALILVGLVGLFFPMPAMQLALAFMGVLIFSGYILYDTSRIIQGGETNYIMATIDLYLDILNLFLNLLRLVSAFSSNDD